MTWALSRNFNPRSPCGERQNGTMTKAEIDGFQSTLPMRGATLICCPGFHKFLISIHAPHAGSDLSGPWPESRAPGFQSTLPMRGATPTCKHKYEEAEFQSTLPMRGATQRLNNICIVDSISIHAPHAGSDRKDPDYVKKKWRFQSTLPMRGATRFIACYCGQ